MDSHLRTIIKAVTWQIIGVLSMTLIGLIFTGSLRRGGGIALAGAAVGVVVYILHERIWARIRWGRMQ